MATQGLEWIDVEQERPPAGASVEVLSCSGERFRGYCQNNSVYCFVERTSLALKDCQAWRLVRDE